MRNFFLAPYYNMTDEEHYQNWAETHTLSTVTFWWYEAGVWSGECRLNDKTFNQALKIAKELGFSEPRWFKPWTWGNGVVTVG